METCGTVWQFRAFIRLIKYISYPQGDHNLQSIHMSRFLRSFYESCTSGAGHRVVDKTKEVYLSS